MTVTDAIEAGALAGFGTYGQRAVLAAQAGMDLLLCAAQDVSQGQSVAQALASALDGGRLNSGDFTAAVRRITALRNALHRAGAAAPGWAAAAAVSQPGPLTRDACTTANTISALPGAGLGRGDERRPQ